MKILARIFLILCLSLSLPALAADHRDRGLSDEAKAELVTAGVTKYVGQYQPILSQDVGDGWTKHTFDPAGGAGPLCIAGTPYSAFTRVRNPNKVMIFLQGGGACWQDFYFCNVLSEAQEPGTVEPAGIFTDRFDTAERTIENPLKSWSIVYLPYCDGSVFNGDNDVFDPAFGQAIGVPQAVVRFHRGLRNATAGIDLAKSSFPNAKRVLVAGSSAGGVGAVGLPAFIARIAFGNRARFGVFNDAGPVAINPFEVDGIAKRAADWRFGQFYPPSCLGCDDMGQGGTALIDWRLDNDATIREAFYSTDGDLTNRFFLQVPTQAAYRGLVLGAHDPLHAEHEDRYKRFIRSGANTHIALQSDQYYEVRADGTRLVDWMGDFLRSFGGDEDSGNDDNWEDIVEDFVPAAQ